MKIKRHLVAGLLLIGVTLGVSACAPAAVEKPDVKIKTSACLIRSSTIVPGTPEKQLAADLVEARIVYGLGVREVKIDQSTELIPARLLQALQAGCVLMVSANPNYLDEFVKFASEHSKMMVLFVGSNISVNAQPANFRWVADDALSGARLAGFFAAGKSKAQRVHLFIQPVYSQATKLQTSFIRGVKDFDEIAETTTETVFIRTASSKTLSAKLATLDSTDVAAIFGGKSIWQSVEAEVADGPYLIGADLQLGDTELPFGSRVLVSVERNTSKYVFNAVASLMDRKFAAEPLYRKPGALKFNTVELRVSQPDSVDGSLLAALETYRQSLISPQN
jgi:basic membrane lipoprotein Med (substrate-binding protein (PBP1-ABC) superfamily)